MDGLLKEPPRQRKPFRGFGPTAFSFGRSALRWLDVSIERPALRREIRSHCPTDPGVYGMIDRLDQLIYVGVSRQLRERLLSYFVGGDDGSKQRRIAGHARQLVWEVGGHELTARLRELELIRRWRPRFNAQGRPGRSRQGYIYLTATDAPQFRADKVPSRCCRWSWGPVPLGRRTRAAAERLNHVFRLRDCSRNIPIRFSDQLDLFAMDRQSACLRGDVGSCLAPCAGRCTRQQYVRQLEAARRLLDGTDRSMLDRLQADMQQAASEQHYERAASLRDASDELTYLVEQIELVREVREAYWFVYPVPCHTGRTLWKLIAGGDIAAVVRAPHDQGTARKCRDLLERVYSRGEQTEDIGDFGQIRLIASWFRQHPEQLQHALEPEEALSQCKRAAC
jgi:excinuclease ABC subunit C